MHVEDVKCKWLLKTRTIEVQSHKNKFKCNSNENELWNYGCLKQE